MEIVRVKMEQGAASLQRYLVSVEVRDDTKISLLLGLCAGIVCVVMIAVYPGKPIDYSGTGLEIPLEMRGRDDATAAPINRARKEKDDSLSESSSLDQQQQRAKPEVQQRSQYLERCENNQQDLRRRNKRPHQESSCPGAQNQTSPVGNTGESDGMQASGEHDKSCEDVKQLKKTDAANGGRAWDPDQLDGEKLARKIGSSKAARMLGLTEDQVRQAVLDAKEQMKADGNGDGKSADTCSPSQDDSVAGVGLSGVISLIVMAMGLLGSYLYLSTHRHGPLAQFLVGLFPREMEVLGLSA